VGENLLIYVAATT
jgi:ribonuclease HI